MDAAAIKDVFAERLADRGLPEDAAKAIAASCAPCILLKLTYGWRPWPRKGRSRFGGAPDVPRDFIWPRSQYEEIWGKRRDGEPLQLRQKGGPPLTFVAQLDLAEIAPLRPPGIALPEAGLLSIFYDRHEMPNGTEPGDPTGWRIYHFKPGADLISHHPPTVQLKACAIAPRKWLSLPSDLSATAHIQTLREADFAAILQEAQKLDLDGQQYRMFGHPGAIKASMETQAEAFRRSSNPSPSDCPGNWRLLIQFPTDYRAKVDWCETGTLFVWIHQDDLACHRFENAWVTWQAA